MKTTQPITVRVRGCIRPDFAAVRASLVGVGAGSVPVVTRLSSLTTAPPDRHVVPRARSGSFGP